MTPAEIEAKLRREAAEAKDRIARMVAMDEVNERVEMERVQAAKHREALETEAMESWDFDVGTSRLVGQTRNVNGSMTGSFISPYWEAACRRTVVEAWMEMHNRLIAQSPSLSSDGAGVAGDSMASKVLHIPGFLNSDYHDLLLARLQELRPFAVVHSMRVVRKVTPVKSKPKLVFAIGVDGAYGLYNWGQIPECFSLIAEAPEFVLELMDKVRLAYPDLSGLNHLIITFGDSGNSGIPPHQDKAFSSDSSGSYENGSTIALMNMGAR